MELIYEVGKNLQAGIGRLEDEMRDIKFRTGSLEGAVVGIQDTLVHHSAGFDRIHERLARIEKRMDLVEA